MTCVIDDDAYHYTECNRCGGEDFGTPRCKPEPCPVCEKYNHESAYIRVLRNYYVNEKGQLARRNEGNDGS